MTDSAEKCN